MSLESPDEIQEVLKHVAKTATINNTTWSNVKMILGQKIKNIEKEFFDTSVEDMDIPQYPNVDNFNFDRLKASLLDRLELFVAPPFTIQRMCELLVEPKKQYSRIDKFMRALEKNILVVSTVDNCRRQSESEFRDNFDISLNGSDSIEISVEAKLTDEPSNSNLEDVEKDLQKSPKEVNLHRLDEDFDDSPSPKKMKLDSDSDFENEHTNAETDASLKTEDSENAKEIEKIEEIAEKEDDVVENDKISEASENNAPEMKDVKDDIPDTNVEKQSTPMDESNEQTKEADSSDLCKVEIEIPEPLESSENQANLSLEAEGLFVEENQDKPSDNEKEEAIEEKSSQEEKTSEEAQINEKSD